MGWSNISCALSSSAFEGLGDFALSVVRLPLRGRPPSLLSSSFFLIAMSSDLLPSWAETYCSLLYFSSSSTYFASRALILCSKMSWMKAEISS